MHRFGALETVITGTTDCGSIQQCGENAPPLCHSRDHSAHSNPVYTGAEIVRQQHANLASVGAEKDRLAEMNKIMELPWQQ